MVPFIRPFKQLVGGVVQNRGNWEGLYALTAIVWGFSWGM
jgi:hypothetical protein